MKRKMLLLMVAVAIAAIGATLVVAYAHNSATPVQAAASPEGRARVLVATAPISPGETATQAQSEGKLALKAVPTTSVVSGAVSSVDSMTNMVALSPIYPGEQILSAMFGTTAASRETLSVPHGMVAVSLELTDPGRVAGFVTPGSHVAIFVSYDETATNGDDASFTRVIVHNAEVLAVGPNTVVSGVDGASQASNDEDVATTILTVALSQQDADKALFSDTKGTVAFGLLGRGTTLPNDPGVTLEDIR